VEIAGEVDAGDIIGISLGMVTAVAVAIVTPDDKEPTIALTPSISINLVASAIDF
jgi:hypothetical protein